MASVADVIIHVEDARTQSRYSFGMAINLPLDPEQSVRRHISSGQVHSADDVLRAALQQLDEMDLISLMQSADDEKGLCAK